MLLPTDRIIGILRKDQEISPIIKKIENILTAHNLLKSCLPDNIHQHVQVANVTENYLCLMVTSPTIAFRVTNKKGDILEYFHKQGYSAKEIRIKVNPHLQIISRYHHKKHIIGS